MTKESKANVRLDGNTIYIVHMNHPSCVTSFIRCMRSAAKRGLEQVNIVYQGGRSSIFPDACLPIAVLINRSSELFGIDCKIVNSLPYLKECSFEEPLLLSSEEIKNLKNPFDKILMYSAKDVDSNQIASIVQSYVDCVSKSSKCEEGVLTGLIWCINEVMDNVLIHSKEDYGYIMAQIHRKKGVLAICVCDVGIGIYESLKASETHSPKSETDAITLALQEGVGDGQGQGNGLFGLYQIVNENGGTLTISSGRSAVMLRNGNMEHFENDVSISDDNRGTIVDFQLDLSKKIDIKKALKSIGGFDGFDIRIDNMIQEDNVLKYDVFLNSSGTGTRNAGAELRNDVINIIKRTGSPIVLDFSGVQACSSSFIDEFIAKMVFEMGVVEFSKLVTLVGMNEVITHLCERSIAMRMYQSWDELQNDR